MKFLTIFLIALTANANDADCTEHTKVLVHDTLEVAITFQKNPAMPDHAVLKSFLHSSNTFVNECTSMEVDLVKYENCIDSMSMVFPLLPKLMKDLKEGNSSKIVMDLATIAMNTVNALNGCMPENPIARFMAAIKSN